MGYEVSRRRVYGPEDRYCNGSGLSSLHDTLEEAEQAYEDYQRDCGYPSAVFLFGPGLQVLKQSGPSLREVDAAMNAAYRRRCGPVHDSTGRLMAAVGPRW